MAATAGRSNAPDVQGPDRGHHHHPPSLGSRSRQARPGFPGCARRRSAPVALRPRRRRSHRRHRSGSQPRPQRACRTGSVRTSGCTSRSPGGAPFAVTADQTLLVASRGTTTSRSARRSSAWRRCPGPTRRPGRSTAIVWEGFNPLRRTLGRARNSSSAPRQRRCRYASRCTTEPRRSSTRPPRRSPRSPPTPTPHLFSDT